MIVKHFPTGLIGLDLVSVQPMKGPKPDLRYLDFVYIDKLKERRLKIEKLYERIKLKQNGDINEQTTEFLEYNKCN